MCPPGACDLYFLSSQHRTLNGAGAEGVTGQSSGSYPEGPVCNLMLQREKDWVSKIQMMQLHQSTDPYLNDFYYQVVLWASARMTSGTRHEHWPLPGWFLLPGMHSGPVWKVSLVTYPGEGTHLSIGIIFFWGSLQVGKNFVPFSSWRISLTIFTERFAYMPF